MASVRTFIATIDNAAGLIVPYPYAPEEPWQVATSTKVGPAAREQTDQPATRRLQVTIRDILVITAIFSFTLAAFLDWFLGPFCALYTGTVWSFAYLSYRTTWRQQLNRLDRSLLAGLAAVVLLQAAAGYAEGYFRLGIPFAVEAALAVINCGALILTGVAAVTFAHNLVNLWTPDPFLLPACARGIAASAIVSVLVFLCAMSRGPSDQMYWHGHDRIATACMEVGEAIHCIPTSGSVQGERVLMSDLGGLVDLYWKPNEVRFERSDGTFTYLRQSDTRTYRVSWRSKFGIERRIGEGRLDAFPYGPVR